jgi:cell division septum initiation protein DivIVA
LALDRQDIEKRDFPIGRRGYDPDAVERHLRAIADEVEALQARARRSGESLAGAASERVEAILQAAETSASEIQREATERAEELTQRAASEARDHVARVSEATSVLLERVDAMESELGALVESLRSGAKRLDADLRLLQGNMGELRAAATGSGEAAVVAEVEPEPEAVEEKEPTVEEKEPTVKEKEPTVEETPTGADGSDSEGARLIALNMALNGTPREETERYLAENFDLPDREALLDEVYARVG